MNKDHRILIPIAEYEQLLKDAEAYVSRQTVASVSVVRGSQGSHGFSSYDYAQITLSVYGEEELPEKMKSELRLQLYYLENRIKDINELEKKYSDMYAKVSALPAWIRWLARI